MQSGFLFGVTGDQKIACLYRLPYPCHGSSGGQLKAEDLACFLCHQIYRIFFFFVGSRLISGFHKLNFGYTSHHVDRDPGNFVVFHRNPVADLMQIQGGVATADAEAVIFENFKNPLFGEAFVAGDLYIPHIIGALKKAENSQEHA